LVVPGASWWVITSQNGIAVRITDRMKPIE
jgi:hypothetical protein